MPANLTIGPIWIDVSISEKHGLTAEVSDHPVERGTNIVDHIRPTPRTVQIEGLVTNHPTEQPLSHAGGARALEGGGDLTIDVATIPGRRVPPMTFELLGEPTDYGLGFIPGSGQATALAGAITGALGLEVNRPRRRYAAEQHHVDTSGRTFFAVNALTFSEEFDRVGAVYAALVQVVNDAQPVRLVTGLDIYDSVALTDLSFDRSAEIGPNVLRFSATCTVLRVVSAQTVRAPVPTEHRGKPAQSRGKQQTTPTEPAKLPTAAQAQLHTSFVDRLLFR